MRRHFQMFAAYNRWANTLVYDAAAALTPEELARDTGAFFGPLIGTLFMFYVIDYTSGVTSAWLLLVGVALILLILFFPKGLLGSVRERWLPWLP